MTTPFPSPDDPTTMTCPVCRRYFTPTGRQRYCTSACRKTAFHCRHQNPPAAVVVPVARPRGQFTIYECPCWSTLVIVGWRDLYPICTGSRAETARVWCCLTRVFPAGVRVGLRLGLLPGCGGRRAW